MTEMVTSGSMSGGTKRSDGLLGESDNERRRSQQAPPVLYVTALVLDSTVALFSHVGFPSQWWPWGNSSKFRWLYERARRTVTEAAAALSSEA